MFCASCSSLLVLLFPRGSSHAVGLGYCWPVTEAGYCLIRPWNAKSFLWTLPRPEVAKDALFYFARGVSGPADMGIQCTRAVHPPHSLRQVQKSAQNPPPSAGGQSGSREVCFTGSFGGERQYASSTFWSTPGGRTGLPWRTESLGILESGTSSQFAPLVTCNPGDGGTSIGDLLQYRSVSGSCSDSWRPTTMGGRVKWGW